MELHVQWSRGQIAIRNKKLFRIAVIIQVLANELYRLA